MSRLHMEWTNEDDDVAVLVKEEVGDDAKRFVDEFNSMRPDRERTAGALYHRAPYWILRGKVNFSKEFLSHLGRLRWKEASARARKRAEKTTALKKAKKSTPPRRVAATSPAGGVPAGWMSASEISEELGYSTAWIYLQKKRGRVEARRFGPAELQYYNVDQVRSIIPPVKGSRQDSISQTSVAAAPPPETPSEVSTQAQAPAAAPAPLSDSVDSVLDLYRRQLLDAEVAASLLNRLLGSKTKT